MLDAKSMDKSYMQQAIKESEKAAASESLSANLARMAGVSITNYIVIKFWIF